MNLSFARSFVVLVVVAFGWLNHTVCSGQSDSSPSKPLKTLNDHFPFEVPESKTAWDERASWLRRNLEIATGVWPPMERTPLNAVIHGRVERDGFTLEKVYFESLPGHYVTGTLFRPSGPVTEERSRPGILCPHGHGGRLHRMSDKDIAKEIEAGREKFAESGSTPKLARCVQLARMGCTTFIFDMLGYADSVQISYEIAHRHAEPRPEEARSVNHEGQPWPLFSIDAELRLQSIMGLQTWNAMRALDFLASLPDVDPNRLGVTGNSGGGTQSIVLGALDPRLKVSYPNGMVSTSMQGGCYCENCSLLRVDTGNVELAGLMAPRPQAMTAVDDWTRDMMTDGYPQLQQLYRMVGRVEDVRCDHFPDFPHNFNYVTRSLMYPWMNRYLNIGASEPIVEEDFSAITDEEATVWNAEHPRPAKVGVDHERDVCAWMTEQATRAINKMWPQQASDVPAFAADMRQAWRMLVSIDERDPRAVTFKTDETVSAKNVIAGVLRNGRRDSDIPLKIYAPAKPTESTSIVVWCLTGGMQSVTEPTSEPGRLLKSLNDSGLTVIVADLRGQGSVDGQPSEWSSQPTVKDSRHYAGLTFGYNRTLVAERVSDVLDLLALTKTLQPAHVALLGTGSGAPVALIAGAITDPQAGDVDRVAVLLDGFKFVDADSYQAPNFVPGSVKFGDVSMLVALTAPRPLWIRDSKPMDERATSLYSLLDQNEALQVEASAVRRVSSATIKNLAEFFKQPH